MFASGGSIAVGGDVHGNVTLKVPRPPAAWPHQVGTIPPQAGAFQHRAQAEQLREAVAESGTAVLSQVLTGMGGVGKTQLAADYARTAWELETEHGGVDVLIWISASSRDAIVAGYAQAGVELCSADADDAEQAARAFLAWLQPKPDATPCRWLVVMDDLTDPTHVRGLWPPASPTGRTLVTTRRRDAALAGRGRVVTVGLFTEAEAVAYLTDALDLYGRSEADEQLADLARDLGYLPLALSQAAAYITDTLLPCAAYRALLADQKRKLADLIPEDSTLPDDQTAIVAATWALSIEHANKLRPAGLARPMLHLATLLDPSGIPATVLNSQTALAHLTEHRTPTNTDGTHPPVEVSAEDAVLALRALHRLNLIDHSPTTPYHAVRVHQLIQRATRDSLTPDQRDRLAVAAADALIDVWPFFERDTTLARTLRANATALIGVAEDALYRTTPHGVLYRAGKSLGEAGQADAATAHFHRMAEATHHHLGPDHLHTLNARYNRAHWRGAAGDIAAAVTECEELLADTIRALGPHPLTGHVRHALVHWRGEAGDPAGAAAALEDLLADEVRVMGPDLMNTLSTRIELARWRGEAGDAAGAVTVLEMLMSKEVRVLHPDHPDIFRTRYQLARWRGEAGDAAGAVAAYQELLADMVRVMGPDHPDTLNTRAVLGQWRGKAGDPAGAVAVYEELLADMVRVMGPDHPDTLNTRAVLGQWRVVAGAAAAYELLPDEVRRPDHDHRDILNTRYRLADACGEAGDAAGAAAALEDLLADVVRMRGPDHQDTATIRNGIIHWRREAGEPAGAAAAYEELLAEQMRVMGPDHEDTLNTRIELARWRGEAGDPAGAAAALEELLADVVRVLGPDHQYTLETRDSLAYWLEEAGDAAGAAAAYEELLADAVRVLGPDHEDTLNTRYQLARCRRAAGDAAGAAAALEELLVEQMRVLGPDHQYTLGTRHSVAEWRGEAGDAAGAAAAYEELLADVVRMRGPGRSPGTATIRDGIIHWRREAGDAAGAAAALEELLADE